MSTGPDADLKTLRVKNDYEWRSWLQQNHLVEKGVWLVFYKKGAGESGPTYDEAVDGALCFGWIDSVIKKIDDYEYVRKFTPRRPGSIWSKSNIRRVERLTKEDRMTEYGLMPFKERGNEISIAERFKAKEPPFPPEFLSALRNNARAWRNFQKLAPGYRKRYLMWITSAKATETRTRRIEEAVGLIAKNLKSLLK
jgi:uncharacterized protein YdeI (YjbR/CyaY-like superfamily)